MKAKFLLQYLTELMLNGDINEETSVEVIEGHSMAREIYEEDFDPELNRVEIYPVKKHFGKIK